MNHFRNKTTDTLANEEVHIDKPALHHAYKSLTPPHIGQQGAQLPPTMEPTTISTRSSPKKIRKDKLLLLKKKKSQTWVNGYQMTQSTQTRFQLLLEGPRHIHAQVTQILRFCYAQYMGDHMMNIFQPLTHPNPKIHGHTSYPHAKTNTLKASISLTTVKPYTSSHKTSKPTFTQFFTIKNTVNFNNKPQELSISYQIFKFTYTHPHADIQQTKTGHLISAKDLQLIPYAICMDDQLELTKGGVNKVLGYYPNQTQSYSQPKWL